MKKRFLSVISSLFILSSLVLPGAAFALSTDVSLVEANMDGFQPTDPYNLSDADGYWANGTIDDIGNDDSYPEGTCIPILLEVENEETGGNTDIQISPWFDYKHSGTGAIGVTQFEFITVSPNDPGDANNLNDFSFSGSELSGSTTFKRNSGSGAAVSNSKVNATIAGPYEGTGNGNGSNFDTDATGVSDTYRHYNITLSNVPHERTVYVVFCARLGADSQDFGGNSIDLGVIGVDTTGGGVSDDDVAIDPDDLTAGSGGSTTGNLTVTKVVTNDNGGTKVVADFPLFVTPDGGSATGVTSGDTNAYAPGDYTVSETSDSNYTATFSGDCDTSGNVTVEAGVDKTCTITNDDIEPATLTVTKVVVNDNGGSKVVADFPLFVTPDGGSATGVTSGDTNAYAPGDYTVSETGDAGYTASYDGDCDANGDITLTSGQVATCTVTNDDKPAQLTVKKVVNSTHGGSADSSQFTMDVTGTDVSDDSFPGDAAGTTVTLDAGSYAVTESSLIGYTQESAVGCDGLLALGQTQECVITNVDMDPTLKVTKVVVGGPRDINTGDWTTADPGTFELFVTGGSDVQVTSGVATSFPVGNYVVSEVIPDIDDAVDPEYIGVFTGSCEPSTGAVSLAFGDSAECTLTNYYVPMCQDDPGLCPGLYDVASTLSITKSVTNNDGGLKTSGDFSLTLQGSSNSGATVLQQFAGSIAGKLFWLLPGTYTVTEDPVDGYAGDFSGCGVNGSVTLGTQETLQCGVVNDDIPGNLTVTKVWDGPTAPAGFELTITQIKDAAGNDVVGSSQVVDSGADVDVAAGTYQVSETPGGTDYAPVFTGDCDASGVVEVELDETLNCTVTNRNAPTLTVTKVVINNGNGTAVVADFPLQVTPFNGSPADVVSGETNTFAAGDYTVSEIYDTDNGVNGVGYYSNITGDCDGAGTITLAPGGTYECTITNDDFTGVTNIGGGGGGGGAVLGETVTQETTEEDDGGGSGEEGGETQETTEEDNGGEEGGSDDEGGEEEEEGEVLEETTCTPYITSYIHIYKDNNPEDVTRLQTFLNNYLGLNLGTSGVYDQGTFNGVKQLQSKHADEILKPWGLSSPTGYVYITTRRFINTQQCDGMSYDPGPLPTLTRDNNINDNQ